MREQHIPTQQIIYHSCILPLYDCYIWMIHSFLGLVLVAAPAYALLQDSPPGNSGFDTLTSITCKCKTQVRVELYDVWRTKFVQAHSTALACLALSLDGKLLATASERGTLVRVFNTSDGTKLQVSRLAALHYIPLSLFTN